MAVEDERRTVFGRIGAQTHIRGVGAGVPFRKRERGNLAARDPRQIFFLLFFRAEKQQWLRDANRLMGRNERSEICVPTSEQHRRAPVIYLRQTEAAVLLRNFHAESAHREKIIDVFLRNFTGAIDFIGVDIFTEIFF